MARMRAPRCSSRTACVGTMKGFKKLEDAVKAQLRTDRAFPCPVIQFKSEKYKHSDYGWIHNPIFEVVDWADMQGNLKSDGEAESGRAGSAEAGAGRGGSAKPRTKPALVDEAAGRPDEPAAVRPAQRRRPPAA